MRLAVAASWLLFNRATVRWFGLVARACMLHGCCLLLGCCHCIYAVI